jgi:CxxC motif-containing protein
VGSKLYVIGSQAGFMGFGGVNPIEFLVKEFAIQEHTDPRRVVTTTVRVTEGVWPRLPVKTAGAIPKGKLLPLCRALHKLTLAAPVKLAEVVLADALGTGIDVVATRDLPRA